MAKKDLESALRRLKDRLTPIPLTCAYFLRQRTGLNEFSESDRSEPTPSDDELIDDEASEDRGVEELPIWVVKRRWSIFAGDIANTVICSEPTIRSGW